MGARDAYARSRSGNTWSFLHNTEYWIFTNAAFAITGSTTAGTSAQSLYNSIGGPFASASSQVANFTLGGVVATPEPSTWALTGAALCGLAFFARRTRCVRV
jgi:hypothetical protein